MSYFEVARAVLIGLLVLIAAVLVGGNRPTASSTTPSSQSGATITVREQQPGETVPAASSALQSLPTSGDAVDTRPACQRPGTQLAYLQGGACANQGSVQGLMR